MIIRLFLFLFWSGPALAEAVVANQIIRARTIITTDHIRVESVKIAGAISDAETVLGQEATVTIYPGRPLLLSNIAPPAILERNQLVSLVFMRNGLAIQVDGRSLSRAAQGDMARVLNLDSRKTVSGIVQGNGTVLVKSGKDLP